MSTAIPATPPVAPPARRTLEAAVLALLALAILLVFWSQQRYPALLKKLHAGPTVRVSGAISFDALLPVHPVMPADQRILRTGVNWLYTNRFGMYFALPFGAAMMTLLAAGARPRAFRSAPLNVLCGAVAGAPAGVCTNCATPIAQSLLAGGASSRLTIAALISSPSFNPVVVAMTFVLFPLPLALLRVAAPALLLVALPLLVPETFSGIRPITIPELPASLRSRLGSLGLSYLRNLRRLTLMTLPWMLLAALGGAVAAELIPAYGTHLHVSLLGVVAVALLGTLLPVPMALDVALSYVLYHAGVPLAYVAALLCTLGPVSIYSLAALTQQLAPRASLRLAGATALLGSLAGLLMMYLPVA